MNFAPDAIQSSTSKGILKPICMPVLNMSNANAISARTSGTGCKNIGPSIARSLLSLFPEPLKVTKAAKVQANHARPPMPLSIDTFTRAQPLQPLMQRVPSTGPPSPPTTPDEEKAFVASHFNHHDRKDSACLPWHDLPTPATSPIEPEEKKPARRGLPSRPEFIRSLKPVPVDSLPMGSRCPLCFNLYRSSTNRTEPPILLDCNYHVGLECLLRYIGGIELNGLYTNMCPIPFCSIPHDLYLNTRPDLPVIIVTEPNDFNKHGYMYDEWISFAGLDDADMKAALVDIWDEAMRVKANDIRRMLAKSKLSEENVMEEIIHTISSSLSLLEGVPCLSRDLFRALSEDIWQTVRILIDCRRIDRRQFEWTRLLARLVVTKFVIEEFDENLNENDGYYDYEEEFFF